MLLTHILHDLEARLVKLQHDDYFSNFKLSVELNLSIVVYIRVNDEQESHNFEELLNTDAIAIAKIVLITDEKADYIDFDENINLDKRRHLDMGKRRRLGGFISPVSHTDKNPCPVFCFYSYKGGVGRTTTLAAFATYLATVEQKKVVRMLSTLLLP